MTDDLHRLVYYSRNRLKGDFAGEVRAILAASRRNNTSAGVTGALMFNAGCFAQVLEGPLKAVETIFERIQQDERHSQVAVIASGPTSMRRFPTWAMAFVGEKTDDLRRYAQISDATGFDLTHLSGDEMTEALLRLVQEDEFVGLERSA